MANCPVTVPTYIELGCFNRDPGRVVALAFIDEDKTFTDPSAAAEWLVETYASSILIHQQVRGSYAKPSANKVPGYGDQSEHTVGRTHTLTARVPSVKGNEGYWNALNKSRNYKVAFVTGEDYGILYMVDKLVNIDAGLVVEEGLDSEVAWDVMISWVDIDSPATYDCPTSIFKP